MTDSKSPCDARDSKPGGKDRDNDTAAFVDPLAARVPSAGLNRVVVNDERFLPESHVVNSLARLYLDNAHKRTVAQLCDDFLDPTGRLLGLVRKAATGV